MVAALYQRLAPEIINEDPNISVGGPSLIDPIADTTLDDRDESWTKAFLEQIEALDRSSALAFLSTELYPVEDLCEPKTRMLSEASALQ